MLQWIPGRDHEIIWNDRDGDGDAARLVSRILDVESRVLRTLDGPVSALTPDGASALGVNFVRLHRARPTYGYVGAPDPSKGIPAPADDGIFHIDLATGRRALVLSLAEIVAYDRAAGFVPSDEHYIDSIVPNPTGTRFAFFERWGAPAIVTRVLTANLDGSGLFVIAPPGGHLSHAAWLDDERLVLYSTQHDGYTVFRDAGADTHGARAQRDEPSTLLETSRDGHQSFLAGGEWMLTDTYGDDDGTQHVLLYHVPTETIFTLAHLAAPQTFTGTLRCDHHPRISRNGRKVVVDSAHRWGRQMYLIDIGPIIDAYSEQ